MRAVMVLAALVLLAGCEEALPRTGGAPPVQAAPEANWRGIDHVVRIDVRMPRADWEFVRNQGRRHDVGAKSDNPTPGWSCSPFDSPFKWREATVWIDGQEYRRARIRKKGFYGSLSTTKPSLKLRLDKYVEQDHRGTSAEALPVVSFLAGRRQHVEARLMRGDFDKMFESTSAYRGSCP